MTQLSMLTVGTDRESLRRLTRFLVVCGYDVQACGDFDRAVRRIERNPPDLIAVFAGNDPAAAQTLIRTLRKQDRSQYCYAVQLCEDPSPADVLDAFQDGWDDLLVAPLVHGELLARLRTGVRVVEFERRRTRQRRLDVRSPLADRTSWLARLSARLSPDGRSTLPQGTLAIFEAELPPPATAEETDASAALVALAERLQESLPGMDTPARWNDRSLAVLLPFQDEAAALQWAETWLSAAERATASRTTDHPTAADETPAVSIGLAALSPQFPLERAIERAEGALRTARESGGNLALCGSQFDAEQAAWSAVAGDGKLFMSTTAGDVMLPCALLISAEETPEQALRVLRQTELSAAPVVDRHGHYLGVVTTESLARNAVPNGRTRQSGSLRLVRHLVTQPPKFDERTTLARLVEFFSGDPSPFAVVLSNRRPIGLVHCHSLAALNTAPTATEFASLVTPSVNSRYLLVGESE